jgi:dienelactone hydrolase
MSRCRSGEPSGEMIGIRGRDAVRNVAAILVSMIVGGCATAQSVNVPRADTPGNALPVEITRPDTAGPLPVIVWLHGCNGLRRSAHAQDWNRRLVKMGYVVAMPDSFTPRGYPNGVCGNGSRVPASVRAGDAYATIRYLESLPNVLADRIGLIGHSHGGWTVLAAIDRDTGARAKAAAGAHHDFAAAIAFYPECAAGAWISNYRAAAPLLILAGELDDWTPVAPCRALAERTRLAGQPVGIKVYPGAYHAFDSYAPIVRVPEARQGQGAMIGGNADARADSIKAVEGFFAAHLGRR